jgi:hypothetical protein
VSARVARFRRIGRKCRCVTRNSCPLGPPDPSPCDWDTRPLDPKLAASRSTHRVRARPAGLPAGRVAGRVARLGESVIQDGVPGVHPQSERYCFSPSIPHDPSSQVWPPACGTLELQLRPTLTVTPQRISRAGSSSWAPNADAPVGRIAPCLRVGICQSIKRLFPRNGGIYGPGTAHLEHPPLP